MSKYGYVYIGREGPNCKISLGLDCHNRILWAIVQYVHFIKGLSRYFGEIGLLYFLFGDNLYNINSFFIVIMINLLGQ